MPRERAFVLRTGAAERRCSLNHYALIVCCWRDKVIDVVRICFIRESGGGAK
jgi:hypothetical protein